MSLRHFHFLLQMEPDTYSTTTFDHSWRWTGDDRRKDESVSLPGWVHTQMEKKESKDKVRVTSISHFSLWVTTKTVILVIQLFNPGSGCGPVTAVLHLTEEDHTNKISLL